MKIEVGSRFKGDAKVIDSNEICFVAEDGRTLFEVRCGQDGRSIEVRAVECCRVGGVLYSTALEIRPKVTNVVEISTQIYPEQ